MLRTLGSLKLAVVLIAALALAMSAASVYETRQGTQAALRVFYSSAWFAMLMGALGVNVLASLLIRWPWRRNQTGFVVTHVAILVILLGALITKLWSVNGQLWLRPQETRSSFDSDGFVLMLASEDGKTEWTVPVGPQGPAFDPEQAGFAIEGVRWTIEEFAEDTIDEGERVLADPNGPRSAAKLRVRHGEHDHEQWLMRGQPIQAGRITMRLLRVDDPEILAKLLEPKAAPASPKRGKLLATLDDQTATIDVDTQLDQTVALGETGYTIRLRRYLAYAQVSGKEIRSLSTRPANPMIEFELTTPDGKTTTHRVFARFPDRDFPADGGMQASTRPAESPVTFRYEGATILGPRTNSWDLIADAKDQLYACVTDEDGSVTSRRIVPGKQVDTPWAETHITVLEYLPRARQERVLKPIPPRPRHRVPAAKLCLKTDESAHRLWLRRGESYDVHIGGRRVRVGYVPPRTKLGFEITLLEPVITKYPGSQSPRTYESRVRIRDEARDVTLERTISMNAPLEYGGYSFYQSSYQFDRRGDPAASMLSVVTDPGEPVVYVGYTGLMLGMIIILFQKIGRYRRARRT